MGVNHSPGLGLNSTNAYHKFGCSWNNFILEHYLPPDLLHLLLFFLLRSTASRSSACARSAQRNMTTRSVGLIYVLKLDVLRIPKTLGNLLLSTCLSFLTHNLVFLTAQSMFGVMIWKHIASFLHPTFCSMKPILSSSSSWVKKWQGQGEKTWPADGPALSARKYQSVEVFKQSKSPKSLFRDS